MAKVDASKFPISLSLSSTNTVEEYLCPCGRFVLNANYGESKSHIEEHGYREVAADPKFVKALQQDDGMVWNPGTVIFQLPK